MKNVDLIEFLALETEKHVSAYKEDFLLDKKDILEGKHGQSYIWAARENGTHIWEADYILWKEGSIREMALAVLRLWKLKVIYRIEIKSIEGEKAFGSATKMSLQEFKRIMRDDVKVPTLKEKLVALRDMLSDSRSIWKGLKVDDESLLVSKAFSFFFHDERPAGLLQTYIPRKEALGYIQKNLS